jgi:hypothetical protein
MKHRFVTLLILLVVLVTLTGSVLAANSIGSEPIALLRVNVPDAAAMQSFAATGLPAYAVLDGFLLAGVPGSQQGALDQARLEYHLLDADVNGAHYYLAEMRGRSAVPDWEAYGRLLLNENGTILLRMQPAQADRLTLGGVELTLITLYPKPLPDLDALADIFPEVITPDPLVQVMIDQVTTDQISEYDRQLAGELPVWVDGAYYTITSRYTFSGTPIQKTTSFVGQHMSDLGLDVEYHNWGGATYPNVIGEIPGMVNPEDIFIIGAHLDDVQGTPGADDNASGSVATLLAADILSQYQWGCTLRFAFWTGEEQGLNGSYAYAQRADQTGENIVGYLNLDMIAWNTPSSSPAISLVYSNSLPPTYDLALLFADVVDAYNLNLVPTFDTGVTGSDHYSFWQFGFTSILGIEDMNDFNPYYHGSGDTPAHTDLAYFTDFTRASLGTFAHMSNCLIPSGLGYLDGSVSETGSAEPIPGATVVVEDGLGHSFSAMTDASGYYTRTLLSGVYTGTASAYGYLPSMVSGITIVTDTVTPQDFSLSLAPTFTVSGTVTETGSGSPLYAEITFDGSPASIWSDPSTGFYSAALPEGTYTMHVRADLHLPGWREIVVDQDQTQNFILEPLPCILLVDDDMNDPDVRSYYTSVLDNLGYDYNVWDTSINGDPTVDDLLGYQMVLWFTGYPYNGTFTGENETAVATYLDAGGKFFLSSQDYLYEYGLTGFGTDYLHIASFSNDVSQTTVTGQNVFAGLGPYTLSYPFTNYSDTVNPDAQSTVAFTGNVGNAAVSYSGATFKTVFLGYPLEAVPPSGREAIMSVLVDFFGGCITCDPVVITDLESNSPVQIGETMTFTATVWGAEPITYTWDFGGAGTPGGSDGNVWFVYDAVGQYSVNLNVSNACPSNDTQTLDVNVFETRYIFLPVVSKGFVP